MKDLFIEVLTIVANIISGISIVIVVYGTIIGFIRFVRNEMNRIHHKFKQTDLRRIRVECGSYLLLGLEFLIASDILETVLHPDLQELALLGGIVIVRIVLSYFLNREIKELNDTGIPASSSDQ
ncbi:MAG: DUF1622 domain-containing protein [Bacteroidales bacterium]